MANYSPLNYSSTVVSQNLDWVFLVDWILLLFAAISIIFHFNRYIGIIITFFLRLFVWNRYKVRIKIKAVKISLLGGRVFFKNVTIITQNETISILQGTLTWRYWLNSTLQTDFELENNGRDKTKNESLPTRFLLQVYGLEVFMYNRVYAYENLMDFINKSDLDSDSETKSQQGGNNDSSAFSSETFKFESKSNAEEQEGSSLLKDFEETKPMEIGFMSFLNTLPMTIEIKKGAFVFGNKTTSSILVLSYSQSDGVMDISKSKNRLDPYKSELKMNFTKPKVLLKPNLSYIEPHNKFKPLRKRDLKAMRHGKTERILQLYQRVRKILQGGPKQTMKEEESWNGLRQYVDNGESIFEEQGAKISINHDEYAKYSEIVEAEQLFFCYYYDVAGTVPVHPEPTVGQPDIGNGGSAPTYGLYLSLSHGVIHYGPWANRERVGIQKMLFPSACRDSIPAETLQPGDTRKYAGFKIKVHVADEITMRVPFREFSKNTKVDTKDDVDMNDNYKPPFGWIELKLQKDSVIVSDTSYLPTAEKGWDNHLKAEFILPELRTSTNHDIFLRADIAIIHAELGFPLQWNGLTHWVFHNRAENAEIFLLREHIILLSDMVSDFSYGVPTPYDMFKPFIYDVDIDLVKNYKLFLNVNDNNVINNPLDFNDNVYLSFQGESLLTKVNIPLTTIVKKSTCVSYQLSTDYFDLILNPPPWHTLNNFLKSKTIGRSEQFNIQGSYTYHSIIDIGTVDTIVIDCTCEDTVLELYGFVLRYMLKIKENYFGIHKIFKTLLEFTDEMNVLDDDISVAEVTSKKDDQKPSSLENEMDLLFSFSLQRGCLILPSNIYDCDSHIGLYFNNLDVDIRYTNYYMDLQCDISEIKAKSSTGCSSLTLIDDALTSKYTTIKEEMVIAKVRVHGHRMFGLPPLEPTYFCKWDFVLGKIAIVGRPLFAKLLVTSLKNLGFSLKDTENLFVPKPVVLNDIVVITFQCPMISIALLTEDGSSIKLALSPIEVNLNDLANERYSLRLNLKVDNIQFKLSNKNGQLLSFIETSVDFSNFNQKQDFLQHLKLQQEHIRNNDAPFHRLPFLITKERDLLYRKSFGSIKPSFSLPEVSVPLNSQSIDLIMEKLLSEIENFQSVMNEKFDDFKIGGRDSSSDDRSGFNLLQAAKSYYSDSEYSPSNGPDPEYEHDSFVVNLSSIDGVLNPDSLDVLVNVFDEFNRFTIEGVMDSLHVDTILGLRKLSNASSSIKNIRLVTPLIDLKWGQFEEFDSIDDLNQCSRALPDYLEILAYNVSSVISLTTKEVLSAASQLKDRLITTSQLKDKIITTNASISALHVKEINLNMIKAKSLDELGEINSKMIQSSLLDLELWSTNDTDNGLVSSVNIRELDVSMDGDELDWIAHFINSSKQKVTAVLPRLEEITTRKDLAYQALLYHLATAGATYYIEHDPAVLTKPAYIMRSSKNHIRSNDSWKIVVRLRHILQNLSSNWIREADDHFQRHEWNLKDDSCATVLEIFRNWRSWEFSDISNCYLFRQVFKIKSGVSSEIPSKALKKLIFASETLAVRLTSSSIQDDYILLRFLNCSLKDDPAKLTDDQDATGLGLLGSRRYDIVFSLGSVEDRLSPLSLRLKNLISALTPDKGTQTIPVAKEEPLVGPVSCDISAIVHQSKHLLFVDKVGVSCFGAGFTFGVLLMSELGIGNDCSFNIALGYDTISSELLFLGKSFAAFTSTKGHFTLSSTGKLSSGLKKINCSVSELVLDCDQETDEFVKLIDTIANNEAKIIKEIISTSKSEGVKYDEEIISGKNKSVPLQLPGLSQFSQFPILFSAEFDKITWDVGVISPFKYAGYVNTLKVTAHIMKDVLVANMNAQLVVTNIISGKKGLLRSEMAKFEVFAKVSLAEEYNLLNVMMRSDRAALTIPQLIHFLLVIHENEPPAKENVKKLQDIIGSLKNSSSCSDKSNEDDAKISASHTKSKPLLVRFHLKNKYAALVTSIENVVHRLDTSDISLSLFNYAFSDMTKVSPTRLHGEVDLPSSRFVIGAGSEEIPIVGLSLVVRVTNPDNIEHLLQTLQVELRYCRVFLTPDIVAHLLSMQKTILSTTDKFKKSTRDMSLMPSPTTDSTLSPDGSILGFFSIHVLAYNICIGWIFDDPKCKSKGIIVGCERIFIVSEEKIGKLTFMDAYLSLAHGSSPSTFFGHDGEFNASTRAFLPNMQFIYAIVCKDGQKNMHTTVTGEQLDVRFEANGVNIVEELLKSFNHYKNILNDKKIDSVQRLEPKVLTLESTPIEKVGFHSIECITSFAGAKVMVYNTDAECLEDCSSFTLESPAVKVAVEYIHRPELSKKHSLKVEITTSASNNTLYATCVPVIENLSRGISKMMRSSAPHLEKLKPLREENLSSQGTFLDDLDIDLGVRIEPQEIALSCEPTAKVKASGSFQGLDFRLGTDKEVVWVISKLEGFQASLQHVYSRETSGSIIIEEIILTAFYNFKDHKKVSTSAFVSEIRALINVKQLQDLDLFRDIWTPAEFLYSKNEVPEVPAQIRSKRIANHVRDASSSSAMPWMIEVLILQTNCTINMGKSLGVLNLNAERLWAVSKKGVTWEQNLRLAINRIALTSEGRLGGEFSVEKFTLLSAISWMANNRTYEHPLVVLSAGIESIRSKSSLDFHTFFVCNIQGLALSMFNKRGISASAHDSLYATADVKSLELYFTALAASNFWDIYNTLLRIHKDNQVSYTEVLRDSSNKESSAMLKKKKLADDSFVEIINGLTTSLSVKIGQLLVHIYPSSLMDSQVLVFKLAEADARFFQNTAKKIENKLKLTMTDFTVSLSTFQNKVKDENDFNSMSIEKFFKNSRDVKGGTIFVFPAMNINMDIWQDVDSNVIEYKFFSSFGGKVDVRWNLGSVNFIRDMWTAHANALSSRLESYRRIQVKGEVALKAASLDKSLFETVNLEDKLKTVESGFKYVYVPLAPLVAEAPQLKELGDATPPLEWFGVHRAKFPNVSHQMIIVPLQKMVHEVETQYGRILK